MTHSSESGTDLPTRLWPVVEVMLEDEAVGRQSLAAVLQSADLDAVHAFVDAGLTGLIDEVSDARKVSREKGTVRGMGALITIGLARNDAVETFGSVFHQAIRDERARRAGKHVTVNVHRKQRPRGL